LPENQLVKTLFGKGCRKIGWLKPCSGKHARKKVGDSLLG